MWGNFVTWGNFFTLKMWGKTVKWKISPHEKGGENLSCGEISPHKKRGENMSSDNQEAQGGTAQPTFLLLNLSVISFSITI